MYGPEPAHQEARQMVMADNPRAALEHAARLTAHSRALEEGAAAIGRELEVARAHLHRQVGRAYGDGLEAHMWRAGHLAEIASHNARTWSAIAEVLATAQEEMRKLDGVPLAADRAKAIAVRLRRDYLELLTRLARPEPLREDTLAGARPGAGFGVPPLVPIPSRPPRRRQHRSTSGAVGHPPPLSGAVPVEGTPAASRWWLGDAPPVLPTAEPTAAPDPVAVADATVVVPPPWRPRSGFSPATVRIPVQAPAAALVDRDRLAYALADTVAGHALAGRPEIVTLRGDDGETVATLAATRRHLRATRSEVAPLHLDAAGCRTRDEVWPAVAALLDAALSPSRAGRGRWPIRGRRRPAGRGAARDGALRALGALHEAGRVPVLFVDDLRWADPEVADEVLDAVTRLGDAEPAALHAVLALDPPTLAARLDEAPGRPSGYGRGRVRRFGRIGADLPPRSAADVDPAMLALAGNGRHRPAPVWAATERLADDRWTLDRVRDELVGRPAALDDSERIVWLWRFYLSILDTGVLSRDDADRHVSIVLAVAEIAVRWHDLKLDGAPAGGLPGLLETCDDAVVRLAGLLLPGAR